MPMIPFVEKFPELGVRETRSVRSMGRDDLPDGEYAFVELYCNEPGCDCRRVTIDVLRPETGWNKIWATISYGWESVAFYRQWGGRHSDPVEMKGPVLDTLNPQSRYSAVLLDLFRLLIESPEYVQRLEGHYRMFRAVVDKEHAERECQAEQRVANRRKRLRDPSRRGKRR